MRQLRRTTKLSPFKSLNAIAPDDEDEGGGGQAENTGHPSVAYINMLQKPTE